MNKVIFGIGGLVVGAVAGALATKFYLEKEYFQKLEETQKQFRKDLDELEKKYFDTSSNNTLKEANKVVEENKFTKEDVDKYKKVVGKLDYGKFSSKQNKEVDDSMEDEVTKYIIGASEYGSDGYEEVHVTYYADGILVDTDEEEVITDAEDKFGYDALEMFDLPNAEDVIYVRNDENETDYEIVRESTMNYADIYDDPDYFTRLD